MKSLTQKKIAETLLELAFEFEDFSTISIEQIIRDAGVSKSTFYKYFQTKHDIFKYIHNSIDAEIYQKMCEQNNQINEADSQTILAFIADDILPLLYKQRNVIKLLYNSAIDPYWEPFLEKRYIKWSSKLFRTNVNHQFNLKSPFIRRLIVKFVLSLIATWITSPFPAAPKEFRPKFMNISKSIIKELTPD